MKRNGTATIEQAVGLFDQEKYQEAFAAFVDIYQQSMDDQDKQRILKILEEAYYIPNIEELHINYEKNVGLLKKYPYVWEKVFRSFEELSVQLFPVSDDVFYCYDLEGNCFSRESAPKSREQMRYFFENLDQPLQVKDEDNFYNLTFLNDNVRASEDFAGDNHIYLMYSSWGPLVRLMQTCDLEPLKAPSLRE